MTLLRWSYCLLSLMVLAGCSSLSGKVDREVNELAALVGQVEIHPANDQSPAAAPDVTLPSEPPDPPAPPEKAPGTPGIQGPSLQPIAFLQTDKKPPPRLVVPPGLPGANAPPITRFPEDPAQKKRYLQELFPPLPPPPQLPPTAPGPEGRPMTLADLQRLAALYSP
ncbi:MAG TPA: hypothetical protein VGY77_11435, partial [Gemmataceae bacterium]|nr:hypothetical protein [Gemmataceae bacterium]